MASIVNQILEQRTRLEDKIRELGGAVPKPWVHDNDTSYRNLQLIEFIEELEVRHLDEQRHLSGL